MAGTLVGRARAAVRHVLGWDADGEADSVIGVVPLIADQSSRHALDTRQYSRRPMALLRELAAGRARFDRRPGGGLARFASLATYAASASATTVGAEGGR